MAQDKDASVRKSKSAYIRPKEIVKKKVKEAEQDVYVYIWITFVVAIVLMTLYLKAYVKEMMTISILFLIFWFIEPVILGVTGNTITTFVGKGKKVSDWKRFPLFFLSIIVAYVLYNIVRELIYVAFPEEHVNFIFVGIWLTMLFVLWIYKFSKEK